MDGGIGLVRLCMRCLIKVNMDSAKALRTVNTGNAHEPLDYRDRTVRS